MEETRESGILKDTLEKWNMFKFYDKIVEYSKNWSIATKEPIELVLATMIKMIENGELNEFNINSALDSSIFKVVEKKRKWNQNFKRFLKRN